MFGKNLKLSAVMFFLFLVSFDALAVLDFVDGRAGKKVRSVGGVLSISNACYVDKQKGYGERLCVNGKEAGVEEDGLSFVERYEFGSDDVFVLEGCGGNSCQGTLFVIKVSRDGKWVVPVGGGIDIGSAQNPSKYKIESFNNGLRFVINDGGGKERVYIYDGISIGAISNGRPSGGTNLSGSPKDKVAAQLLQSCLPDRQVAPGAFAVGCFLWPGDLAEKSSMFRDAWVGFERSLPGLKETERRLPQTQQLIVQPLSQVVLNKEVFFSFWMKNKNRSVSVLALYSPGTGRMMGVYKNRFVFDSDDFYRAGGMTVEQASALGVRSYEMGGVKK